MTIKKTTLVVTVLHSEDEPLDNLTLQRIAFEMAEGSFIGIFTIQETVAIPPDKLLNELYEIGNDGTFFDED